MWRLALALVILLTACSEGDRKRVLEALKHVEAVAGIAGVVAKSDTLMVSDVLSVEGTPSLTEYECVAGTNTCTRTGTPLFEPANALEQLVEVTANPDVERADIRESNGVGVAEYSVTATRDGIEWATSHYGGWLDYSAFETTIARAMRPGGSSLLSAYSISFGQRSGSTPQINVTWEGVMLGHTRGQGAIDALQGDALIDFTFDTMTLDVSFSNVVALGSGDDRPAIVFSDVPVGDGVFTDRTATAHIAGRFYGPAHEEVGGVFTYPTALGSFGARKQ